MDCVGHGTHVSGIIAAEDKENPSANGVAPDVTLYACKYDKLKLIELV
jgi:subtilisin family serine protease